MRELLLLLLGLISFPAFSQYGSLFQTENATWATKTTYSNGPTIPPDEYLFFQTIGDTTINDRVYQKVYFSSFRENELTNFQVLSGALRKENEKVFQYDFFSGEETLLYDFTLEVGDTLEYNWPDEVPDFEGLTIWVSRIDTVTINNIQRRHWYFKWTHDDLQPDPEQAEEFYVISDLYGSEFGLNHFYHLEDYFFQAFYDVWPNSEASLYCAKFEEEVVYGHWNDESCSPDLFTSVNELEAQQINVFPNPVSEVLHLSAFAKWNNGQILDINGQVIIHFYKQGEQQEINVNDLPKGIYFLRLRMENQWLWKKVVKQ
ncbi:MAG: T9SS type A sorting domain-containing protein [Saprospiraceae bacterium]|nr:T9SS type A sorting domain-containing protein [Saprospiraceae bacterium]